jgi:methyltransferase (TIGR00027 family)
MKVTLTEEKETLLATLYGRALDARSPDPILGDKMAAVAVDEINYDFSRLKITPSIAPNIAVRAKHFDDWTREFLDQHRTATVVHLAAGLDTRVWRVNPGPGVQWFDVDYPEVIELRSRLFPARPGYRMVGSSVTDEGWLDGIPADRPVLVVAEGLTMYLRPEAGHELFRRITDHFEHGTIAFDCFNSTGIKLQKTNPAVRGSGATLYWGIDDPQELSRANPKLHLTDALRALYAPGSERLKLRFRIVAQLLRVVPSLRDISLYLRYEF